MGQCTHVQRHIHTHMHRRACMLLPRGSRYSREMGGGGRRTSLLGDRSRGPPVRVGAQNRPGLG
jgi:hypothetical protein